MEGLARFFPDRAAAFAALGLDTLRATPLPNLTLLPRLSILAPSLTLRHAFRLAAAPRPHIAVRVWPDDKFTVSAVTDRHELRMVFRRAKQGFKSIAHDQVTILGYGAHDRRDPSRMHWSFLHEAPHKDSMEAMRRIVTETRLPHHPEVESDRINAIILELRRRRHNVPKNGLFY